MVAIAAIATTRAVNSKFTYTLAGNLHTLVLVNAYTDLPLRGKSILLSPHSSPQQNFRIFWVGKQA